jgi:hypothetical protein
MREVLVAVFDTVAKTDEAVHALESAKVPTASVRRYHKGDPALSHINVDTGHATDTTTHLGSASTAPVEKDRSIHATLQRLLVVADG